MRELERDVCRIVVEEVRRIDEAMGREDASAHESFGRISESLDAALEMVKPIGKSLDAFWKEVKRYDKDTQAAMLQQMQREAERATVAFAELSARIARGIAACAPGGMKQKLGQMDIDDLQQEAETEEAEAEWMKVDPETGEVIGE